jgi:hypothetical protein
MYDDGGSLRKGEGPQKANPCVILILLTGLQLLFHPPYPEWKALFKVGKKKPNPWYMLQTQYDQGDRAASLRGLIHRVVPLECGYGCALSEIRVIIFSLTDTGGCRRAPYCLLFRPVSQDVLARSCVHWQQILMPTRPPFHRVQACRNCERS